jgi:hypothetical protein
MLPAGVSETNDLAIQADGTRHYGAVAGWTALIEDVNGNLVPRPGGILRQPGSNPWRG